MALKLNGVDIYPTQANFNNNSLTKIRFNNVVVWSIDDNYFWIEQLTGASIISYEYINHWTDLDVQKEIYYSFDSGATWTKLNLGGVTIILQKGTKALFKSNDTYNFYSTDGTVLTTARIKITSQLISGKYSQVKVGGKIMSLYNNNSSFPFSFSDNRGPLSYFFQDTRGLVDASDLILPSFTSQACYRNMFKGCVDLVGIPKLPALSLSGYCYADMFDDCTSLKFSETQTDDCQYEFRIPYSGTGTAGTNSTYSMLTNTSGTYHGSPSVNTVYYTNAQGVQPVPPVVEPDYFYLKCLTQDGPETPATVLLHDGGSGYFPSLYYSFDKSTWNPIVADTGISMVEDDIIYIRANDLGTVGIQNSNQPNDYNCFGLTDGTFECGGDITTILNKDGGITDHYATGYEFSFARMFQAQSRIRSCANLILPTTIGYGAFHYAFYQSGILDYPDFSGITKIGGNGFASAFREVSASGSVDFSNVTEYPMKEGDSNQFALSHTFRQSGVTSAKFSSTIPTYRAFNSTFYNCSTIQEIEVGWTNWGADSTTINGWVNRVSGTGTFKCPVALGTDSTIERGNNRCPAGWTVVNI